MTSVSHYLPFEKYQATGNDFIILDFMDGPLIDLDDVKLVSKMCDRHFGIGADGLIALAPEKGMDFRMIYLNSDGRYSSFCGNGSRSASAYFSNKMNKKNLRFQAADGKHKAILKNDQISVQMGDILSHKDTEWGFYAHSGSPHIIVEVEDPDQIDVVAEGRRIRNEFSSDGANINFISYHNDVIRIRTYERGVENRTLSCGTGMTAAAYYVAVKENLQGFPSFLVKSEGGNVMVNMKLDKTKATEIHLKGPAQKVFSGFYPLH